MNWVDIAISVMVLSSTVMGMFWGLIRQVVSLVGLVGGIYMAGRFYPPVAEFLHGKDGGGLVADANWARIIAFALVVIGFSVLVGAAGSVLRLVANLLFLGWLDHLLGAVVGLLTSLLLVMALLAIVTIFPVPNISQTVKESVVAGWLGTFMPAVQALLPPEFGLFRQMMGWGD